MTDLARLGIAIDATKVTAADAALDGLAASARDAAQATKSVEASAKSAGDALGGKVQPAAAGAAKEINAAAAATDNLTSKVVRLVPATASAKAAVDSVTRSVDNLVAQANRFAGVRIFDSAGRAGDIAAYGQELDRLRAKFNPLYAAGREYKAVLAEINMAAKVGALTERERTAAIMEQKVAFTQQVNALRGVGAAYDAAMRSQDNFQRGGRGGNVAGGPGSMVPPRNNGAAQGRAEMINFFRQIQDVVVSIGSGQSLGTVALQQGAQIGDVVATSEGRVVASLKNMASAAGRFLIGPTGLAGMALTAVASIGVMAESFASRGREIERNLIGIGRASGQTAGSIEAMAITSARGSPMSQREMRNAIGGFASQGVNGSLLAQAAGQVRGYSLATGQSYDDSQKELGSALASPTAGAEKLNQRFGFLNQALLDYIRNAEQAGDKTRANKAFLDALAPSTAEAAKQVGAFTRMYESGAKWASEFYSTIERGAGRLVYGTTALQRYQDALAAVTAFEQGYAGRTMNPRQQKTLAERRARAEALRTPEAMAEQKRIDDAQKAVERNAISRQASGVVGGLFDDVQRRQTLTSQRDLLLKALGDPETVKLMGDAGARANDALAAVTASLENFETAAQRAAKDNELAIAQTLAYTMAERTAVEMERARTEALRAGRSELEATTAAEQARQRALAEATRAARDMARDARDELGMIGLSPAQQRRQGINNRIDRFQREYGGDAGGAARMREGGSPAIEYGTGLVPTGGLRFSISGKRTITKDDFLDAVMRFESGGRNIHQQAVPAGGGYNPSTGTVTGPSSAQGYFQITNTTWRGVAQRAGVDLGQYPNAMSAPYDVQRRAAGALYDRNGMEDWLPYNARLRAWVGQGGIPAAANSNAPTAASQSAEATRRDLLAGEDRRPMEDWSAPINSATRALEEQKRALEGQRNAMGMSVAEMTRMSEAQRLQNEYTRDGTILTPQLSAAIDEYARQAGEAAEEQRKLSESQRQVSELNGALADGVKGFISDLRQGKSAAEAFSNALGRIGDKLLDMAINSIFSAGGAQGGLLGTLLKGFGLTASAKGNVFSGGNIVPFAAGGVINGPTIFPMADGMGLAGEAGPEAIMPLSRDRSGRLGVSAPRAANGNRPMMVQFGDTRIEIAGNADNETVAALSEALANNRRDLARMAREMESMSYAREYGVSLGQAA